MNPHRRTLLRVLLAAAATLIWRGALADRPADAFAATRLADTLAALDASEAVDSAAVALTVPTIPENSGQVPLTVEARLPGVRSISLIVEGNPFPLAAHWELPEGALPYLATRLKLRQSSGVIALVRTDDGLYRARREVQVVDSGCDA